MTGDTAGAGEPMREQILGQPSVIEGLLARHDEIRRMVRDLTREAQWIWAVGHGDSYFAPAASRTGFQHFSDIPFTALLAQEAVAYPPPGADGLGVVIAVSMSGGVGRTVEAAAAARARGARVLVVTNASTSRLAALADETIHLGITEPVPFLAGTVTYTASIVVLLLAALSLGGTQDDLAHLHAAVSALQSGLACETEAREWTRTHKAAPIWYFLGMGPHIATAHYGSAKLAEVADAVGIAQETEEFFHEHHWVVRAGQPVAVLTQDAPSRARAETAVAHLRALNVPVCVVGSAPPAESVWHARVPEVPDWCAPLVGAVPLQWMAYWLARAKGLDPDRRTHLLQDPRYAVSRRYR